MLLALRRAAVPTEGLAAESLAMAIRGPLAERRIIDTAAGISENVTYFITSAQEVIVVASPELHAGMALRVDCSTPEPGELPWVARHLFFGLQDPHIRGRETVRLHDAMAVWTRLRARLDGTV